MNRKLFEEELSKYVREVPDFPKPGIMFKDITPILQNPLLANELTYWLAEDWKYDKIDAVAGIESRGFVFGMQLAQKLHLPFVPIRKKGKLPYTKVTTSYSLEYGTAEIEMHIDAFASGANVLIHDDLLATGGTAAAAANLIRQCQGNIAGYSFLIELSFLKGRDLLKEHPVKSLLTY